MKRKILTSLALTVVITLIMASSFSVPAYAAATTVSTKTQFIDALAGARAGDVINIENVVDTIDHMIMRDWEIVVIPNGVTININQEGYLSLENNSKLINNGTININFNKLELQGSSVMENYGTIINYGSFGVMQSCFFKNDSRITNYGGIYILGKLINNGEINNLQDSYFLNEGIFENSGTIEVHENLTNNGPLINTGTIITTNLTYNGILGYIENYGIIDNQSSFNNRDGSIINYNLFINSDYIYNGNADGFINNGVIEGNVAGWAGLPPINAPIAPIKVVPTAYVIKTTGNTNQLFITISEYYPNNVVKSETYQIIAKNNDATVYKAGKYNVYVNVKGNTDVRECRLA